MNALPPKLKGQVNIVRQSKGFTDSMDVDVVIRTTRDLLSAMTPAEVKSIMGTRDTTENLSKSQGFAARIFNGQLKVDTSSSGVATIPIHSNQVAKVHKNSTSSSKIFLSNNGSKKYCELHKSKAHNTSKCKAYARLVQGNGRSAPSTPSVRSNSSRTSLISSKNCFKCGAPNWVPGHECITATRTGSPPSSTLHHFG
jgi:hypothetical protein